VQSKLQSLSCKQSLSWILSCVLSRVWSALPLTAAEAVRRHIEATAANRTSPMIKVPFIFWFILFTSQLVFVKPEVKGHSDTTVSKTETVLQTILLKTAKLT
jgi:hypothetical protein